ncbi:MULTISPECIES: 7,8-didemethyl-8-hydroxy-5-deazariboflavin synthase CofG [Microbacterium]|uniref:7,8-didemethyl-8-hydroxy-5-deazariboflavin synthase n=1 Tax=Microbacterium wangchenii TaxID=2541726 RepID=A0ABX5SYD9_9MICO|nr:MULTISPECIES: 7,8-didemethyl-8-hydroxy-5-deazariboflavin synthase CofG [Microbacterium]MCK6065951.1 7,8-didemethyl-8-hydroxy-5-deazariboflavin synthase CofG [Microbacterium sp. EYE_512]QBR90246.1 7,8-didemethyl-8-hydroxy-5-deazariboflavin synthase subunit CofG [Microbacterium wangchenii]
MTTGSVEPQVTPRGLPQTAVRDVLARAAAGAPLDADDTEVLLAATDHDLEALLDAAAAVRDAGLVHAGRPAVLTYSRKVFVPLTTLCRDRCHYCVFVDTPGQLLKKNKPAYMSPEQVLAVVRQGQALGCKEALLTLGDRPEDRWPEARAWLDEHGYASTLEYVGAIARLITAETGMLAHLNPGVMSAEELRVLRPTAPSMGMMLETTSTRLFLEPGQVHFGSPDKDPALRLAVIENAGRLRIPFTTGILVGIGETLRDRAESLIALRDLHERYGHVQEVIVQNFRAKPHTAMQGVADADLREYVAAVAAARLVFGPRMRIQVPPNLSDPAEFDLLIRAGADDWGGVSPLTADHVNPERPWPQIDELARLTAHAGYALRERLTAHPEFVRDAAEWIDPALHPAVSALADADGLAVDVRPSPLPPVQNSGDTPSGGAATAPDAPDLLNSAQLSEVRRLVERAAGDPLALDDAEWETLLRATGSDLGALTATADDVRRYTVGETVSLVINRNLTSTGYRAAGRDGAGTFGLADAAAIAADAASLGATELCIQGRLPDEEDPQAYLEIVRAAKGAAGDLHVHAYRPQDVWDLAERAGLGLEGALGALRAAGVDTVPGTGVKVLSERVRALVAPGDLEIDRWTEGITAAHRAGFRSTSVLFYGHVETARERIAHLRALRGIQDSTGGFTEFVPIPLPGYGTPLVPGRPRSDEHRAMVAVSRLLLSGSIPHIQIPWTRVGRGVASELLRAGGDDLGGTLLDGRVLPDTGIEQGLELPVADAERIAARLFRPFRQRTTDYRTLRQAPR